MIESLTRTPRLQRWSEVHGNPQDRDLTHCRQSIVSSTARVTCTLHAVLLGACRTGNSLSLGSELHLLVFGTDRIEFTAVLSMVTRGALPCEIAARDP